MLRKLQREVARPSHRRLVAINAANELLDAAAAHCFRDPVAATDLVRWNQMRRQPHLVVADLERGPAAFGELRITREAADLWSRLPEPRHARLPAWSRFREAALLWLDVHQGRDWSPPAASPPPPEPPTAPALARPEVGTVPAPAPTPAPAPPSAPPHPRPRGRSPGPGLTR